MDKKQRLFIYDRKELMVLLLLGVMVAFFAFTLGVHLGKKVGPHPIAQGQAPEASAVATTADHVPTKQEFQEQNRGVNSQVAEESMSQALHDEIERTGMKLDHPKEITLPKQAKAKGSANSPVAHAPAHPTSASGSRHFALQIGSYPSEKDARDRAAALKAPNGLSPYVQGAEVKGKGKWYRVYLGSYPSKEDAEKAGERLKSSHLIDAFVIARVANPAE